MSFAAALAAFRRGDLAAARLEAEAALATDAGADLRHLLGVICCRSGDISAGVAHLREALAMKPDDLGIRVNLATGLTELGQLEEAATVAAGAEAPPLWRIRGHALQSLGRPAEAAACYERVVSQEPNDFESWNNLGNARREAGQIAGAVAALRQAVRLRPQLAPVQVNLAAALTDAGFSEEASAALSGAARAAPAEPPLLIAIANNFARLGRHADALATLERAAAAAPGDPSIQVEIGLAHGSLGDRDNAEIAYRAALAASPGLVRAYVELGILLDHSNRTDEVVALLEEAGTNAVSEVELAFIRALSLRRAGKLEDSLALARSAPPSTDPNRKAQLIGEVADRLGDTDIAFAAFEEMNRLTAANPVRPRALAAAYRQRLEATAAVTTEGWFRSWQPVAPAAGPPCPVFLVGFPRSGTTLLDTILMGHADVEVLEEQPLVQTVADAVGDLRRLADLNAADVERLRALYFAELGRIAPGAGGKTVIDKMPLNIEHAALIHRLFPDARFVFALRHPCDVVLSCFMQNFGINQAMANFLDLGDAARLYDLVLGYWQQCRAILPMRVHDIRYEALVADLEAEVRPLLDYLGLAWDDAILDHQRTARARGYISSASYAQVTERLYSRASGRWQRYRDKMTGVLPVLAPWAERLGYTID